MMSRAVPPEAQRVKGNNMKSRAGLCIGAGLWIAAGMFVPGARGDSPYMTAWIAKYPNSTLPARMLALTGSRCNVCHIPPTRGTEGSCYREAIRELVHADFSIEDALAMVEGLDSDGDGVPNGTEILTVRADNGAEVGYHPGLVGALGQSPCGPTPEVAVTGQLETPVVCRADFDGDGFVTGVDFDLYVAAFEAGDVVADFDGDGFVTGIDFDLYVAAFEAGC